MQKPNPAVYPVSLCVDRHQQGFLEVGLFGARVQWSPSVRVCEDITVFPAGVAPL